MLYQIKDGTMMAGGQVLLAHFDFELRGKEHVALVGPNGAGKTTFLRLIHGEIALERDDRREGRGIRGVTTDGHIVTGLLPQTPFAGGKERAMTAGEYREQLIRECCAQAAYAQEQSLAMKKFREYFTGFGFTQDDLGLRIAEFSGGQRTKLALIRLMMLEPDILLLDEPTNHLDIETVQKLEKYIQNYSKAVVEVSHDRFFLDETAQSVWEFDMQTKTIIKYSGGYTAFREERRRRDELQRKRFEQQQEEIRRLEGLVRKFRGKPRKAAFARTRKKTLEKMERIPRPRIREDHFFTGEILPERPGPKWVFEAKEMGVGWDRKLFEISLRVRRGQKIGILGPNGIGKTSFLKTVAGQIPALSGRCILHENVSAGYFDQMTVENMLEGEDAQTTVLKYFLKQFPGMRIEDARGKLAMYLFCGEDVYKKVSVLSGGEKARLALAVILLRRPNLLLLDEPTNHMDIPARETIESALRAYRGTVLFISHDRYFIDRVADQLLLLEEQGGIVQASFYPFGYRHYLERRNALETAGDAGDSITAKVTAENEALVSSLQSVPKAAPIQSRTPSDGELIEEWQLRLAGEEMKKAQEAAADAQAEYEKACLRELIEFAEFTAEKQETSGVFDGQGAYQRSGRREACLRMGEARKAWLEQTLKWYDILRGEV